MVHTSHDRFRSSQIASGIHAAITGSEEGDMELRDMNEQEMRELDSWICKNVLGYNLAHSPFGLDGRIVHPSTNPEDAMAVLKKCHDKLDCEDIVMGRCDGMVQWCGGDWYLYSIFRENRSAIRRCVNGETLELAICLFAKQLFSK